MIERKKFSTHVILFLFLIFFFIFNLAKFYNLPPRIDQSFHIYWLIKILNSDFNFIINLNEITSKFYNKNSSIYELFRVMGSPNNFFSYYFHSFFILILSLAYYLFSFIFIDEWILFFNLFSILFATLNIFISFKIFQFLIDDLKLKEEKKSTELTFIFILIFSSYYLFNFSPLGIHNFSSFFFLLTIYFFLKNRKNIKRSNYLFIGFLSAISAISHMSNLIFLIPTIIFFTLVSNKNIKLKLKLIFYYLIPISIILIPFIFLILFYSDQSYLPEEKKQNLFLNFLEYFKNWFYLIGPISFIVFTNGFFKKNIKNKNILFLYYLIFFHFLLFLILPLNETYFRNYLYFTYLYLIIFSFLIFIINDKKKIIIFLIINFGFNVSLILNDELLYKINNKFYNTYFSNNDVIHSFGDKIKNLKISENQILILPYDQNTLSFIYAYKSSNFDESLLLTDKFYSDKTHPSKQNLNLIKSQILDHESDIAFISLVSIDNLSEFNQNFKNFERTVINLYECVIEKDQIFDEKIFFFNGNYKLLIYKYNC